MSAEPEKQLQLTEWTRAESVAELCKSIVNATSMKIGESKHVAIDGWQSIAAAFGMTAGTDTPEHVEGGIRCKATLRRDSDGAIISTAYGFVGDDEPVWAARPQHSREGMAQTRASSRVLAQKFRFVVTMMKIEGLKTTPAEEMTGVGEKPEGYTESVGVIQKVSFGNGYWGFYLEQRRHWTKEEPLGPTLDKFRGTEVLVKSVRYPGKAGKADSYRILSIEPIATDAHLPAEEPDYMPGGEPE